MDVEIPSPRSATTAPPTGASTPPSGRPVSASATLRTIECGLTARGGCAGGRPLPAVRPLRLRNFQRRARRKMVTLDHRQYGPLPVPEGTTILEAARTARHRHSHLVLSQGHQRDRCLPPVRGGGGGITSAWSPPATTRWPEGMVIHTNSPRVREARRMNLRLLLSQHDTSCTKCTRSGNCQSSAAGQRSITCSASTTSRTMPEHPPRTSATPLIRDARTAASNACAASRSATRFRACTSGT